jgi:hypothetical protein
MLAKASVSLAQTQRLMRHSMPTLTARTYLKLRIEDGHVAVAKIDGAGAPSPKRVRATR